MNNITTSKRTNHYEEKVNSCEANAKMCLLEATNHKSNAELSAKKANTLSTRKQTNLAQIYLYKSQISSYNADIALCNNKLHTFHATHYRFEGQLNTIDLQVKAALFEDMAQNYKDGSKLHTACSQLFESRAKTYDFLGTVCKAYENRSKNTQDVTFDIDVCSAKAWNNASRDRDLFQSSLNYVKYCLTSAAMCLKEAYYIRKQTVETRKGAANTVKPKIGQIPIILK